MENKLVRLLHNLGSDEIRLEELKLELAQIPEFEPFSVFKAINREKTPCLTKTDLLEFLQDTHLAVFESEFEEIIKSWDKNRDGKISFQEFREALLPVTNKSLRLMVDSRRYTKVIKVEIENALLRCIRQEIDLQKNLEFNRRCLFEEQDFNLEVLFQELDRDKKGYLTEFDISFLLKTENCPHNRDEIQGLLRRLGGEEISFELFEEFLGTDEKFESNRNKVDSISSLSDKPSISRHTRNISNYSGNSIQTFQSPSKPPLSFSPFEPVTLSHEIENPSFLIFPFETQKSQTSESLELSEESQTYSEQSREVLEKVVETFKEQIQLERGLEKSIRNLSLKPDFTLEACFKFFDRSNSGFLTSVDLKSVLAELEVEFTNFDLFLLLRHYDLNNSGKLELDQFSNLVLPRQEEYIQLIKKRSILNSFSFSTKNELKEVFETHIGNERIAENIRVDLKNRKISIYNGFIEIDEKNKKFLDYEAIRNFLERYEIYPTETDLEFLFERYDRDQDGKISYTDFLEELTPRNLFDPNYN